MKERIEPLRRARLTCSAWLLAMLAMLAGAALAQAPPGAAPAGQTNRGASAAAPAAVPAPVPDAGLRARVDSARAQVQGKLLKLVVAAPLLLVAVVIVLIATWLGGVLSRHGNWLRLRSSNPYMDGLVRRIVQALVVLAGVLVALDLLGATALVGAVLGSAGVVGLVLGFAFRDIAENYISGILLSLRRPFAPGDHVVIDTREGKVVALDSRVTTLMTLDGNQLRLPNALVFKSVILNYSHNARRRFEFAVTLDAGESIRESQALALREIAKVDSVLADPAPSSLVQDFTPDGIVLRFFGWIDQGQSDLAKVRGEAIRLVKAAYARAGIEAPRASYHVVVARAPSGRGDAAPDPKPDESLQSDTSVNRDIDRQLASEQRASDTDNLLDGGRRRSAAPPPP